VIIAYRIVIRDHKFHGRKPADLNRRWVAQAARGLGVGRRLLTELENHAARHGVRTARLETNKTLIEAISLYVPHAASSHTVSTTSHIEPLVRQANPIASLTQRLANLHRYGLTFAGVAQSIARIQPPGARMVEFQGGRHQAQRRFWNWR
jgi:hypothetical protein